jgi:hypothetical protein
MCHVYSTKKQVDLFVGEAFEYTMIFMLWHFIMQKQNACGWISYGKYIAHFSYS